MRRRCDLIERLEGRVLLVATAGDFYKVNEDTPLVVQAAPVSLRLDGDGTLYAGNRTFTATDGSFDVFFRPWDNSVRVSFSGSPDMIGLEFAPRTGQPLSVSTEYTAAVRYPEQTSDAPGFDVIYNGQHYRPNPSIDGRFEILQLVMECSQVGRFAADFSLSTGLSGWVRYNYDPRVLSNDGAGAPLTAAVARAPAHGTLALNADGSFTYTPHANYFGEDSFTYTASDGAVTSAPTEVKLTVKPVNDAPTLAVGADVTVYEDAGPQAFDAWANVTAGPGETEPGLHVILAGNSNPALFAVPPAVDPLTGRLTFTPSPGAHGMATVTLRAADGGGTSDARTFTITVKSVLDGPAVATGVVHYVYPGPGGQPVATPLAARTVFDDLDRDGLFDAGEPSAVTALDGTYSLPLAGLGTHVVRLAPVAGWAPPAGDAGPVSVDVLFDTPDSFTIATPLTTTMTRPVVIDVVAFYPAGVVADLFAGYFVTANRVFGNSDTNVRINYLGAVPVSYTPSGSFNTDLTRLAETRDAYLNDALEARERMKADLGVLFLPNTSGEIGLGYVFNGKKPDATYGFSAVAQTGNDWFDGMTVAHEIGHNLGADHDPDNGPATSIPYARGYRYTGNDGVLYRDVMAYAPGQQLPFFSSPLITYTGAAVGAAGEADNARAIRQYAYHVSAYRGQAYQQNGTPVVPFTAVSGTVTKLAVKPGQQVPATAVVRNTLGKEFTGRVYVAFYLSKDKVVGAGDTLLKRSALQARKLKPHGALSAAVTFKLRPKLKAGMYQVLVVATVTGDAADERLAKVKAAPLKVTAQGNKDGSGKRLRLATLFQSRVAIVMAN